MRLARVLTFVLALTTVTAVDGQWFRKTVRGSGNVETQERTAEYFNAIHTSTGIDVYVTQGTKESIRVEADDNLLEYIETNVTGNTLRVKTDVQIRNAHRKVVHVTIKDIEELKASSGGDIIGENLLKTPHLYLSASSAGDIRISVSTEEISCKMSSSGDITLEGKTDILEASLSSAGDLKAYDLETREADVSTSSAGDAKIYVTERLRARASSAGDIYYKGNPKYVDAHSSSAGGVHRR